MIGSDADLFGNLDDVVDRLDDAARQDTLAAANDLFRISTSTRATRFTHNSTDASTQFRQSCLAQRQDGCGSVKSKIAVGVQVVEHAGRRSACFCITLAIRMTAAEGDARAMASYARWRENVLPNRAVSIKEFHRALRKHVRATALVRARLRDDANNRWREHLPKSGQFSTSWFDHDAPIWSHFLSKEADRIDDCLEIGSWEGRSLIFTAGLFPRSRLTCIDTFGSDQVSELERRFRQNICPIQERTTVHKGTSFEHLAALQRSGGELFDFIYVDATHFFRHVLTDTMLAWPLLRSGGILVWDDYLWARKAYGKFRAKAAIDFFLDMYEDDIEVLFAGSQVAIRKLVTEARYFLDE